MPLLDESMENLTCDVVIDEERFRGDLNVLPYFASYSHMHANSSVIPI